MSASGKSLLGLWLYRSGEQEWAVKQGSPLHGPRIKNGSSSSSSIVSKSDDLQKMHKSKFSSDRNNCVVLLPSQDNPGINAQTRDTTSISDSVRQQVSPGDRVSIIFTLKNQVGNLARALQVFQELGINVLHLELSPLENATNQV